MKPANDLFRTLAGLAAVPAGAAAEAIHHAVTGRNAVVVVTVEPMEDSASRQAFLERFRRLGADSNVVAVLLAIHGPPGSWAACQDLRAAIGGLRAAGRAVYALLEAPGNAAIWLAAACERVFLVPMGEVALVGVAAELAFFGTALERIGLEPDFEAAGAYKSFGEPYTRSFASPANQEAIQALVADLHSQLVEGIAAGRSLPLETVQASLAVAPIAPEKAVEIGLVDELAYSDQVEAWALERAGDHGHLVKFRHWAVRDAIIDRIGGWGRSGRAVAVIYMDGPIVLDDAGPSALIRARKVVPVLQSLRKDDDVAAVVIHVNSPGGSALASDLLWREVEQLQAKKPVVAVFEDVAASGGYYLAAPAAEILARPGTLTGSIGVFGGKLVAAGGLRKVGVHLQEISAAPNATLFSAGHPFTNDQRLRFRTSLQRFYDGFVDRVAAGRHLTAEAVEPHCRGRVWTGKAAGERGLVDRHGDLVDGIARARELAGLPSRGGRRVEWSTRQHGLLARAVGGVLRRTTPLGAGLQALDELVGRGAGDLARFAMNHLCEPLAVLPFGVLLR